MITRKAGALATAAVVVIGGALWAATASASSPYSVKLVFDAAPSVLKGEKVEVGGFVAGKVLSVKAVDGKAMVTVSLDSAHSPLRDGTTASIEWKALLGERIVNITPGASSAAALPSGALVGGTNNRVELDQVLAALDAPTRAHLKGLVGQLDSVVAGNEGQTNDTIATVGPTIQALGQVLQGIGTDGPALHDLVTRLASMMSELDSHRAAIGSTISSLTAQQTSMATRQAQIQATLERLPATLAQAKATLDKVPATVKATDPLLAQLATATAKLPSVSNQLSPLLSDLVPTLQQLRPTIADLSVVLNGSPELLRSASLLLPQASSTLTSLEPALTFLRPYTPELTGFLSNWGSAAAGYDNQTHTTRVKVQEGTTSPIGVLSSLPPGITSGNRVPGENAGQPWTDAEGDTIR